MEQARVWGALERAKEEGKQKGGGVDIQICAFAEVRAFVESLCRPRRILLSIPAGRAVDETLDLLLPHMSEGDVVIDGGNEHFTNTERRAKKIMDAKRIHLVGMGISGGATGARYGPSLMPGCTPYAYEQVRPVLEKMAATANGCRMVTHVGSGGAGHFVKMVHNGIEYAEMQYLAEAYALLKFSGHSAQEMEKIFTEWNSESSELQSYLMEITSKIVTFPDEKTGGKGYVLDKILDAAGSKGTGKWTVQCAADCGIAAPSIAAALEARFVSAQKDLRCQLKRKLSEEGCAVTPPKRSQRDAYLPVDTIADALLFSRICAYAQGLHLIYTANKEHNWSINVRNVVTIWQGGCIIRAKLLESIAQVLKENEDLPNLLLSSYFSEKLSKLHFNARETVVFSILNQLAVPALSSAVTYFDAMKQDQCSANLIQAQRDFFGAHTYKRLDMNGSHHTDWI
jgi:6-phosphogluconate dehydrogenase